MSANTKYELTARQLFSAPVGGDRGGVSFEFLTESECLDKIRLAYPPELVFLKHLLDADVFPQVLPGSIIIMLPEDISRLPGNETELAEMADSLKHARAACMIMAEGGEIPQRLMTVLSHRSLPLMRVRVGGKILVDNLLESFHLLTVNTRTIHGNMMDVFGLGLLILGRSGIGKSECCLDLLTKGHRLVADDSVRLYKNRHGRISATAARDIAGSWMEIRGVGIIDVDMLYGVSALRSEKDLDLVIEMVEWDEWRAEMKGKERLSPEDLKRFDATPVPDSGEQGPDLAREFFGVHVPLIRIPVGPGRSIANLIEVSARKYLLALSNKRTQTTRNNERV